MPFSLPWTSSFLKLSTYATHSQYLVLVWSNDGVLLKRQKIIENKDFLIAIVVLKFIGAWSARVNNRYQWIEVTFKRAKKIAAIATQERQDANQWVIRYWCTYSVDRVHYAYYKQHGVTKV